MRQRKNKGNNGGNPQARDIGQDIKTLDNFDSIAEQALKEEAEVIESGAQPDEILGAQQTVADILGRYKAKAMVLNASDTFRRLESSYRLHGFDEFNRITKIEDSPLLPLPTAFKYLVNSFETFQKDVEHKRQLTGPLVELMIGGETLVEVKKNALAALDKQGIGRFGQNIKGMFDDFRAKYIAGMDMDDPDDHTFAYMDMQLDTLTSNTFDIDNIRAAEASVAFRMPIWFQDKLKEMDEKYAQVLDDTQTKQDELGTISERADNAKADATIASEALEDLNSQISEAESALTAKRRELQGVTEKIETAKTEVTNVESKLTGINLAISAAEQHLISLRKDEQNIYTSAEVVRKLLQASFKGQKVPENEQIQPQGDEQGKAGNKQQKEEGHSDEGIGKNAPSEKQPGKRNEGQNGARNPKSHKNKHGIPVRCEKCGYEWNRKSNAKGFKARCGRCKHETPLQKAVILAMETGKNGA